MSIFKRYSRDVIKQNNDIFNNELHFPTKSNIVTYTKKLDKNLFDWIQEVIEGSLKKNTYFINNGYSEDELKKINEWLIRCTKEMTYNVIRSHYNFVHPDEVLQPTALACLGLSYKILFGYDSCFDDVIDVSNQLQDGDEETKKRLQKLELDIFKKEDYHVAKKTRRRIGDIHDYIDEWQDLNSIFSLKN